MQNQQKRCRDDKAVIEFFGIFNLIARVAGIILRAPLLSPLRREDSQKLEKFSFTDNEGFLRNRYARDVPLAWKKR
jgi:hypothetical protein